MGAGFIVDDEPATPTRQHAAKCPKLYGEECKCDGYHTFDELYEHRIRLFLALCEKVVHEHGVTERPSPVWCSARHADGSSFGDWFVMGIHKEPGKQITYHLPDRFWAEACEMAQILDRAPEWDKHTSDDVLARLAKL